MPRLSRFFILNLSEDKIATSLDRHYNIWMAKHEAVYLREESLKDLWKQCSRQFQKEEARVAFRSLMNTRYSNY